MTEKIRYRGLDSLRGLGALTVVIAHTLAFLSSHHQTYELTPLYLVKAAHESVIFFFVLSGTVLTFPILSAGQLDYPEFMVQRVCRIVLPYLAVMMLIFLGIQISNNIYPNQIQDSKIWTQALSRKEIANHILLIGNFNTNGYNNVIWSLTHEMRMAIVFPFIIWLISKDWKKSILLSLTLSLCAASLISADFFTANGYKNSYLHSLHYFAFFLIGSLIAKNAGAIGRWYTAIDARFTKGLILNCLLVFCYARMLYLIPHRFELHYLSVFNEFVADWFVALASVVFIVATINTAEHHNPMVSKPLLFLGKISYSLYLVHLPVIYIVRYYFKFWQPLGPLILGVILAVIVAWICQRLLEKPAASLGRYILSLSEPKVSWQSSQKNI